MIRNAATRFCKVCDTPKPLPEFGTKGSSKKGTQQFQSVCIPCRGLANRQRRLRDNYNMTPEEYDSVLSFQNGACAICGRLPKDKRLGVDHCHTTGLIRGALCIVCNKVLGAFHDSAERFVKAAEYLRRPPVTQVFGAPRYGLPGRIGTKKQRKLRQRLVDEGNWDAVRVLGFTPDASRVRRMNDQNLTDNHPV